MNSYQLKSFLGGLKTNLRSGVRTKRKILIIESDDWGAIRTPSKDVLDQFQRKGFDLSQSIYKYDALASASDLEALFELLLSIKNGIGASPKITANAIMANPDFDMIRANNFQEYHYELFTETFKKYPEHAGNLDIWKKGMSLLIFQPQFHGREHLNISRWLKALQTNKAVRYSFDLGSTYSGKDDYAFMEAFDWTTNDEIETQKEIIKDGLGIFEEIFGFKSKSFIAPCYNWDPELEPFLHQQGIEWIQGLSNQYSPTGEFDQYIPIPHSFGTLQENGLRYNIRNVFFEPVNNPNYDWTDSALARIQAAFLLNRPAVVSTHRINYVGFIEPRNRDNGLRQLKKLLTTIVRKWPEVEFISTDELTKYV